MAFNSTGVIELFWYYKGGISVPCVGAMAGE